MFPSSGIGRTWKVWGMMPNWNSMSCLQEHLEVLWNLDDDRDGVSLLTQSVAPKHVDAKHVDEWLIWESLDAHYSIWHSGAPTFHRDPNAAACKEEATLIQHAQIRGVCRHSQNCHSLNVYNFPVYYIDYYYFNLSRIQGCKFTLWFTLS